MAKLNYDKIAKESIDSYKGVAFTLESAIGAMYVADRVGWKPIYLIHDKKTIRKYEAILGINFRESFPEVGPKAEKSRAYVLSQKVTNFWKAVKGEIPGIRTPDIS